jgi:hypothetical protein
MRIRSEGLEYGPRLVDFCGILVVGVEILLAGRQLVALADL